MMAKSTGIVLSGTAISFANEWYQTDTPNFKILLAGMGVALLFDGIEQLDERAAVGLSAIFLVTVLLTPFNGKAPSQTVLAITQGKPTKGGK